MQLLIYLLFDRISCFEKAWQHHLSFSLTPDSWHWCNGTVYVALHQSQRKEGRQVMFYRNRLSLTENYRNEAQGASSKNRFLPFLFFFFSDFRWHSTLHFSLRGPFRLFLQQQNSAYKGYILFSKADEYCFQKPPANDGGCFLGKRGWLPTQRMMTKITLIYWRI